ncbi:MAG: haloacid dehalogenase-like hydrolase [Oscillospiraceae bacterium]|nr:haloacid dehalogenase-like hydrolase [Oscillospiraceae bacterium]
MNAYDFDQTIFYPDSSYCFVMYCLRRYPRAVFSALPSTALAGLRCFLGRTDTRELKEQVFSFLPLLDDVDRIVDEFWQEHEKGIASWYLAQRRDDDLIISASPEFLLRPITDKLGVRLIATRMDRHTGRIIGSNCHDEEKVCRLLKEYPNQRPENFYSDSRSDNPMAWFSEKAWLVKDGKNIEPWPEP